MTPTLYPRSSKRLQPSTGQQMAGGGGGGAYPPVRHPHLVDRVAGVPEGVAHHLAGPRVRVDHLQLNAGLGHGAERSRSPVRLRPLLPHHRVELLVVLVAVGTKFEGSVTHSLCYGLVRVL